MLKIKFPFGTDAQGFFWPEAPAKRIEYLTVKRNHPAVAEATYQCNPGALEGEIFKKIDFRYFKAPRRLMDGIKANLEFVAVADMIVQVWDTAFSARKESDFSVCITAMLVPCNKLHPNNQGAMEGPATENETHYDVYILDVLRERIDFGDLVPIAENQYHKWRPSAVLIEKKASGEPLLHTLELKGIPVSPVEPGANSKRARAIMGVKAGSAQGWVQQHRVWFPYEASWLDLFEQELKNFTGDESSFDDQVDTFVHLCNYAIMQGADAALLPSDLNADHYSAPLQDTDFKAALFDSVKEPFKEACQHCIFYENELKWCRFHQRPMTAFDYCENFQNGEESYPTD